MKCTPIAVWCQNLEPKDALRAVDADTIMIHTNFSVSQVIGGYCLAIKFLINNPTERDRGQKVFDYTMDYATKPNMDPLLLEWLNIAKNLIGKENEDGFIDLFKYDA